MTRTAADYMAQALAQAGVTRIYGVVGDSLNGFTDALRRLESIEWIHVRHEEGAAFAAGAEAHLTGSLQWLNLRMGRSVRMVLSLSFSSSSSSCPRPSFGG